VSTITLEEKKAGLKDKGILLTIQRSAVLDFLHGNTQHPTAEEIYQFLRGRYPALSRATVYNTLDLLKQHGLIQEITIDRSKAHYDYKTEPHHHFFCRHCGRIYDVDREKVHVEHGEQVDGHKIEDARLYVIGICSACLKEGFYAGTP
jgi:Fur family peroxide stress response transcriptional regulator